MIGQMMWDAPRDTSRHHRDDITFLVGFLMEGFLWTFISHFSIPTFLFHQLDVDHESPCISFEGMNISNPPAIGNVESLDPLFW